MSGKMTLRKVQAMPEEDEDYTTIEYNGKTYVRGDSVGVKREVGQFRFWSWHKTNDGKLVFCLWWVEHSWRYFYAERIKAPRKPSLKQSRYNYCSDHPMYGAIRKPRGECLDCWNAYNMKHPEGETKKKEVRGKRIKSTLRPSVLRKADIVDLDNWEG